MDTEDDYLLTDVIIPRLPFPPANQAGQRAANYATGARIEASLRLRQGMGRAVRAEGQPDRRIWILDGRLSSDAHNHRYLTGPCRLAVEAYSRLVRWACPK